MERLSRQGQGEREDNLPDVISPIFIWTLLLAGLEVATGCRLVTDAPMPQWAMFVLFFGLNIPTIVLARRLPPGQRMGFPVLLILGMVVVAANFMRAGTFAAESLHGQTGMHWNAMLHVLSAQALFLAVPACYGLPREHLGWPGSGGCER